MVGYPPHDSKNTRSYSQTYGPKDITVWQNELMEMAQSICWLVQVCMGRDIVHGRMGPMAVYLVMVYHVKMCLMMRS